MSWVKKNNVCVSDDHKAVHAASSRFNLACFAFSRQWNCYRRSNEYGPRTPTRCSALAALVLPCLSLLASCHSQLSVPEPSIEFTRIPRATESGVDKLDVIEGRVVGGNPKLKLVLYAKNGKWWVQPIRNEPYTSIRPDATWTNFTHVATEYAAVLVKSGFQPASSLNEMPSRGGNVVAVATAKDSEPGSIISETLWFSGYEWRIRTAPSNRGGGRSLYDVNNAWTDSKGALHLRLKNSSGEWTCAEVTLTRSLGYGTYSFTVHDTSQLEPAAAFAMFTYDYAEAGPNNREMGVEISPWGNRSTANAQFVIQPFYVPENTSRFSAPSGVLTHSFRWEPGRVLFRTSRGTNRESKTGSVAEHEFTSGVPTHGSESVRMTLYVFHAAKEPIQNDNEVVIEKFEFLP